MKKPTFGARLRRLREQAGLSVDRLAMVANLSRQTVHRLESGQRQPALPTLLALARALRVSLSVFDDLQL